jgi:hypothetical protein
MGRNTLPAQQILEMENCVRTGKEFWDKIAEKQEKSIMNQIHNGDKSLEAKQRLLEKGTACERVIDTILDRKQKWIELN